jgi:hypothetical protein
MSRIKRKTPTGKGGISRNGQTFGINSTNDERESITLLARRRSFAVLFVTWSVAPSAQDSMGEPNQNRLCGIHLRRGATQQGRGHEDILRVSFFSVIHRPGPSRSVKVSETQRR